MFTFRVLTTILKEAVFIKLPLESGLCLRQHFAVKKVRASNSGKSGLKSRFSLL